jgi:hypothetical protein
MQLDQVGFDVIEIVGEDGRTVKTLATFFWRWAAAESGR